MSGAKLPAGSPSEPGVIRLPYLLLIVAELGLLLLLLRQYQIENAAFLRLSVLAFGGFIVHALLPLKYRLPFFAGLSLCGIALVLGWSNGAWLVGLGLVLIGICHIPISFTARGLLLLLAGALLAAQRANLLPFPWPEAIWPVLGSMFMFRLIVYFYDLRHDNAPTSPARTAAYFFMLPNASFPLFPVIDYKTFRRNYYDADAYRIYQKGVDWMVRGVVHLILYRLVYYHWTLAPSEVTAPSELLQYLVSNFLLYLRVSGLFHLIVGMLHLYGFNLPETHNRYLLASSFTDFWRRINIYWKDFMQKVFYYPAVFRLKKLGSTNAIIVATLYVFLMTWFLHAYQWFWLRGSTLLVWQDILFWAILGVLVVFNSLYEMTYGRRRTLGKQVWNWRRVLSLSARTFATFWFICVLWSFWTAESLADWFSLWSALEGPYTLDVLLLPLASFLIILLGSIPRDAAKGLVEGTRTGTALLRERAVTLAATCILIVVSIEGVQTQMGQTVANTLHSLKSGRLSRLDTAKLERGYYESLLSVDRFNSQLWEVYAKKPANWLDVENANLKRFVGGFVQVELVPSYVYDSTHGRISINRWGMRDRDYDLHPGPNTFRAIVLGPSTVMGWGVGDGETFEALVEKRLNEERPDEAFSSYELLNCGVPGYQPPQQLVAFERCMQFKPRLVMYIATGREISRAARYLVEVAHKGIEVPYGPLRAIVEKAGLRQGLDESAALRQLEPYRSEILRFVYSHIAEQARARGAQPAWIFLPQVQDGPWREETPETLRLAREAGFVVINFEDIYKGLEINTVRLAEWDEHPNVRGHQLVAEHLFEQMRARRESIFNGQALGR
jgi:D-alanyl-lipoteichoic acid acyltransferase DltB (MBOAT superfamily)